MAKKKQRGFLGYMSNGQFVDIYGKPIPRKKPKRKLKYPGRRGRRDTQPYFVTPEKKRK